MPQYSAAAARAASRDNKPARIFKPKRLGLWEKQVKDKVFGNISTKQIADELKKKGFNIDKKQIHLKENIDSLGTHQVEIKLHKQVSFNINVILKK